ncbi:MAG: hypothetical protein WKG07_35995 [Hymenobacter sp.]
MDFFDPFGDPEAARAKLERTQTRFLVVSFSSDWRFDSSQSPGTSSGRPTAGRVLP